MYRFALTYEMDGKVWGAHVWAYSFEDAENRVAAIAMSRTDGARPDPLRDCGVERQMKLLIKRIGSNQSVTLCDEDGAVLPDQIPVGIKSIPDDILTATVVLAIGNDVILACDDRGPCFPWPTTPR